MTAESNWAPALTKTADINGSRYRVDLVPGLTKETKPPPDQSKPKPYRPSTSRAVVAQVLWQRPTAACMSIHPSHVPSRLDQRDMRDETAVRGGGGTRPARRRFLFRTGATSELPSRRTGRERARSFSGPFASLPRKSNMMRLRLRRRRYRYGSELTQPGRPSDRKKKRSVRRPLGFSSDAHSRRAPFFLFLQWEKEKEPVHAGELLPVYGPFRSPGGLVPAVPAADVPPDQRCERTENGRQISSSRAAVDGMNGLDLCACSLDLHPTERDVHSSPRHTYLANDWSAAPVLYKCDRT